MNTNQNYLFSFPATHTLLFVAITMCMTIFAILFHYMNILVLFYILGSFVIIYKKNTSLVIFALSLLISSLVIVARINQQYAAYTSDLVWLCKPLVINGMIKTINTSSTIKEQTTLTVLTQSIQNNKNQFLFKEKTISIFVPSSHCKELKEDFSVKIHNVKLEQPLHDTDYQRYLIKEGIWAIAHCNNPDIEIIKRTTSSLRKNYLDYIYNNLKPNIASLFNPLFLGKKEKNLEALNIQHKSVYWGAAHHMARSGVHLSILFSMLMFFFHYANIAHWFRYILSATMLLMYANISFSSISFIRALLMILLHILCKLLKKIPSTLHILTLTTVIVLLYNPMQLLFLDFQLSFGITYILIWLFLVKRT